MINKLEKLIIATGNKGKFEELKAMLSGANKNFADEIIFAPEFAKQINIVENGSSYEENAEIKARAWAEVSGLPCLADDSGLEVEALNNAPGIYSARIVDGDDNARNLWLLDKLKNFKDKSSRRARFAASLVLIFNNNKIIANGICEGYIAEKISGSNGFGYDPLFIPKGFDVTFADLSSEIKNKISHRALAVKNLLKNFKN
ncbi:MAG: RdgB/HAM1 family non-canonical purine NTP pyrophosphatase [Synergistaceae bacterium]|nr:RdgB/HAM1 family non-canonical purine NTP pyrophosphatase [Synergistaceae bacterium]